MLRIVVERNGEVVEDRSIEERLLSIGRANDNDLVLADEQVSAHHLIVKRGGDGIYTAIDQSVNGTFFEGQRISTLRIAMPQMVVFAGYEVTLIPADRTDTVESDVPEDRATTVTDDISGETRKVAQAARAARSDRRPVAKLRVEWEDGRLDEITFVDSAIVGRDEDCDLRIQSREISRKHAFLFRREDDYMIKRLSKVNSIRVNSRVLEQGETCVLHDGDVIDMTGFKVEFVRPESALGDRPTLVEGRHPNLGFSIEVRWESKEIARIELLGFLGEKTSLRFEADVAEVIDDARKIIVDLGYLIGIDENGLSTLVKLAAECDRRRIRLTLANVGPRVRDALEGSSMRKILEPYIERGGDMRGMETI